MSNEHLGIVTERRENRERYERFTYKAPIITNDERQSILKTPEAQAAIERRKRAIFDELVEQEARKAAIIEFRARTEERPSAKGLMELAAGITGVTVEIMESALRARQYSWARHFAMWLVHQKRPDMSTPYVGKLFGDRDHTSVMHAYQNIAKRGDGPPFAGWIADERTQHILASK